MQLNAPLPLPRRRERGIDGERLAQQRLRGCRVAIAQPRHSPEREQRARVLGVERQRAMRRRGGAVAGLSALRRAASTQ